MEEHKHKPEEHQEHKHKSEEETSHHTGKVKLKKSQIWMAVSGVLALLFIISIFTHGFSFGGGIDSAIKGVDSAITQEKSDTVKAQLQSIRTNLVSLKTTATPVTTTSAATGQTAKLDFYIMSKCPYGTQVEDAIKPVLDQLGPNIKFSINYIATDNGAGSFQSLHGDTEVQGDINHLCAAKYSPDKYMAMIVCQNKDASNIPTNWEKCATDNGLDVATIKTCSTGQEGKDLLAASIKVTNQIGATGSPTMYLNDQPYSGGRATADFLRTVCATYTTKPSACSNIPAPITVNAIVLSDTRCGADCDTTSLVTQLKSLFPGLTVRTLDYSEAAGKKLYTDLNLDALPAILFDSSITKGEGYQNVQSYLEAKGDYQSLRIGASFDPKAEICDNKIDDDGNGLIDCADPGCKDKLVCRTEIKKKLDLFVMSHCPYGTQAMDAMKEVLANFKGNMDFSLHYIATDNGDGTYTSLHGPTEVSDDLLEVCAMKYYPKDYKYMDLIWCRNKAITSTDWQSCATSAGMSTTMLETCMNGDEGKKLLSADLKLATALNIGASPSWLSNNKNEFSGLDAQTIKTDFCQSNPGTAGCENTLTGTTPTATGTAAPSGACG